MQVKTADNLCVICGNVIPEGRQACPNCEAQVDASANRIMSPCKNCTDRCIGCHTTCGDYAIYKQELERRRTEVKAENEKEAFVRAVKGKIAKASRDRRKGW